jgi:hypothetical protein
MQSALAGDALEAEPPVAVLSQFHSQLATTPAIGACRWAWAAPAFGKDATVRPLREDLPDVPLDSAGIGEELVSHLPDRASEKCALEQESQAAET